MSIRDRVQSGTGDEGCRFVVHPDGTKMYQDLCRQYYWSGIKRHVGDFVG